ncbi:MAG: CDGSH iron-sulfur domain-containing protein [Alphaproteobacteria bacterium]|nr:CDGSH iron-sulfur domain-containing protein [Alphaproteobacteria bacterium]
MSEQAPATPIVAQKAPYGVDVEAGKAYFWCVCGRSAKQPFCDGAHKGTGMAPMKYEATANAKVWFCGCKATKKSPMCDGTHKAL